MKIKTGRISNQTHQSRFIFLILTVFLTLFYTTLIFGATFHVDPTFTGSVQNGSITNPYNSWSKVTFNSNNSYLQKRGTTASITGSITITGRSNIIIGAYGTGNRPRINKTSGSGHVLDLTTISNCTIQELEISSTSNATSGILIDGYGTAISSNNLIDNCVIHGCEWGVRIITRAAGNRILNTTIHNIGDDGIYIGEVLNIEIGYCNIYNVNTKFFINPDESYSAGDNIQLVSLNNMYFNIHHNTLDHSSTGNKFCFISAGETYSGVIEYNTMIGNSSQTTSCIYLGNTNNTVTVRYNTLKDANYAVYSYASNLQFHYNQIIRNNQGLSIMSNRSLTALNNVFYNNNGISIGAGSGTSVTSRNNIFHIAGSNSRVYNTSGSVTSNNNNFNTQQNGFLSGHSTLASWRSATGNDMNSFVANPLFVNPSNDDFCVQPTSPCINTGINVNQPIDFFGTQVPQSNLPDIGFYELANNQGGNQAPVINNQSFNVASNATNGTIIGTVVATDPNQGQTLTFSITSGNTNGAFALNAGSGVITVANAAALTGNAISLVVRATDNGSPVMWSQATVTINISANSNQAPVINNQSFSAIQGSSNGTVVGTVVATDPNAGQTLTFSITGGNTNNVFAIAASTGIITVANTSAMTTGVRNLTVRATDNGSPVMWSQATVAITVTAAANQAPVINNQSFSTIQGSSNGTVVGTVVATDPNAGQTLTFSITGGNTNNVFAIAASTGIITVANTSAMTTGVSNLTVRATDNGSPVMWSQATVSITVNAAASNLPPVVVNQSFSSAPNPSNGTNIGVMIATDPNPGQTLRYNITGGNTNNAFYILSATGMIRVGNSSAVNPGVFNLTVRVTDNGSPIMWTEATATITVGGGSNQPPVITNQSFSVAANPPGGTQVGTVVATDPNAGQTLSFSITSGNTNNAFNITSSSGLITVGNSAAVNPGVFNLTVRATDNGSPVMWSEATVSINVSGTSNQPPVIANQSFSINENSPNGTLAGTVIASDPNSGQTLTYSIIGGNTGGAFNINASNGNLTVGNTTLLNFEVNPVFNLTVRVTDNGSGNLWSQATVTVNLIDVNEPPVLNPGTFSVTQFAPNGTFVGAVSGYDPDLGQSVTYQIISGNTSGAFHVNYNNGSINVVNGSALNPNVNPVFFLNIRIRDNGSPSLSSTGIIRIDVLSNKTELVEETLTPESKVDPVFNLYPNPSPDGIYTLTSENFDEEAVIMVFDLAGKMVSEVNNFSGDRVSINLEAMPKGIYMIRINSESCTKTIKAIKQ
ncbi:MAG: outer membrane adhesin-like [Bacteroidetes bacterium]|nr:MAG: outer membrane adhesin-like [Bacteroidota bacterium]